MLYTIINEADIFYRPESANGCFQQVGNAIIEGESRGGRIKIRRIISTDPADYLNPHFEIGGYLPKIR